MVRHDDDGDDVGTAVVEERDDDVYDDGDNDGGDGDGHNNESVMITL